MGLAHSSLSSTAQLLNDDFLPLPESLLDPHWYALYTCANREKRVAAEISARGIEHLLPLYRSVRRWKDRRVQLELPLFQGYVFVRLPLRDKLRVLQIPGVVHLVGFGGHPVPLPDDEFAILRQGLADRLSAEPCPFLTVGRRVRVIAGPFAGIEGILRKRKNSLRVIISLLLIQQAVAVEVDLTDIMPSLR